ncbi:MAG: hypothetical protein P8N19_02785 [Flavobacteriales bacterium]|nr:hypothetical protein [Flavobacteriales bacterium]MDG1765317.1 hypothetical protein [Flavobacteriales bacterium]
MHHFKYLVVLLFGLAACKSAQKASLENQGENTTENVSMENNTYPKVIIDMKRFSEESDPFTLKSHEINGDTLSLVVSYSGGCQEHSFDLIGNGSYAKSLPPQSRLRLIHNGNNDNCRSLIEANLKFNVKELRYPGTDVLVIFVEGSDERIMYRY